MLLAFQKLINIQVCLQGILGSEPMDWNHNASRSLHELDQILDQIPLFSEKRNTGGNGIRAMDLKEKSPDYSSQQSLLG